MFVSTLQARPTVTVSLEKETLLFVTVPVFVFPNRTVKHLKRFKKEKNQLSRFKFSILLSMYIHQRNELVS